jgi:hypothetical protein
VSHASAFFFYCLGFWESSSIWKKCNFLCQFWVLWDITGTQTVVKGALDATLRKDSCLWGFLLASYTSKVLKRRHANANEIMGGHWGPRMVVRTIWNHAGEPRGAWQMVGAAGFHRGLKGARDSCRGPHQATRASIMNESFRCETRIGSRLSGHPLGLPGGCPLHVLVLSLSPCGFQASCTSSRQNGGYSITKLSLQSNDQK